MLFSWIPPLIPLDQILFLLRSSIFADTVHSSSPSVMAVVFKKLLQFVRWTSFEDFLVPIVDDLIQVVAPHENQDVTTDIDGTKPVSSISIQSRWISQRLEQRSDRARGNPRGELFQQLVLLRCFCHQFTVWTAKSTDLRHFDHSRGHGTSDLCLNLNSFISLSSVARLHIVLASLAPLFVKRLSYDATDGNEAALTMSAFELDGDVLKSIIYDIFVSPFQQASILMESTDANKSSGQTFIIEFMKRFNEQNCFDESALLRFMKELDLLVAPTSDQIDLDVNGLMNAFPLSEQHLTLELLEERLSDVRSIELDLCLVNYLAVMLHALSSPTLVLPYLLYPYASTLGLDITEELSILPAAYSDCSTNSSILPSSPSLIFPKPSVASWISTTGFLCAPNISKCFMSLFASPQPGLKIASASSENEPIVTLCGRLVYLPWLLFMEVVHGSSVHLAASEYRLVRPSMLLSFLLHLSLTKIPALTQLPVFSIINAVNRAVFDLLVLDIDYPLCIENPQIHCAVVSDQCQIQSLSHSDQPLNVVQDDESLWLGRMNHYVDVAHRLQSCFAKSSTEMDALWHSSSLKWKHVVEAEGNPAFGKSGTTELLLIRFHHWCT